MEKLKNKISLSAVNNFIIMTLVFLCVICLFKYLIIEVVIPSTLKTSNFLISLSPIKNSGAAFSILSSKTTFLIYISFFVLAGISLWVVYYSKTLTKLEMLSVSLLVSGVLVNLYERIVHGYVLDYIKLNFISFPIFNFADVAIVSGAVLYAFILFSKRD
ncbi:signal peptidase II [bacterium]|nr:signal peptidase II [bacterium]